MRFLKEVTFWITLGIDKKLKKQFQTFKNDDEKNTWILFNGIVVNILLLLGLNKITKLNNNCE